MRALSKFVRFRKNLKGLSEFCNGYTLALEKIFVKLKNSGFNFLTRKIKREDVSTFR